MICGASVFSIASTIQALKVLKETAYLVLRVARDCIAECSIEHRVIIGDKESVIFRHFSLQSSSLESVSFNWREVGLGEKTLSCGKMNFGID